jgi:hypothetical protein
MVVHESSNDEDGTVVTKFKNSLPKRKSNSSCPARPFTPQQPKFSPTASKDYLTPSSQIVTIPKRSIKLTVHFRQASKAAKMNQVDTPIMVFTDVC